MEEATTPEWIIRVSIGLGIALFMSLISPLISPFFNNLWAVILRKRKNLSHKDVYEACGDIYDEMYNDKFTPNYILGLDGGGCIVAANISKWANKPSIEFAANRNDPRHPTFPKDEVFFEKLKPIIWKKKILIADDLSNESITLQNAKAAIQSIAREVKIAVISKPSKKIGANREQLLDIYDYYPKRKKGKPEGKWDHKGKCTIHFPWEVWPT